MQKYWVDQAELVPWAPALSGLMKEHDHVAQPRVMVEEAIDSRWLVRLVKAESQASPGLRTPQQFRPFFLI